MPAAFPRNGSHDEVFLVSAKRELVRATAAGVVAGVVRTASRCGDDCHNFIRLRIADHIVIINIREEVTTVLGNDCNDGIGHHHEVEVAREARADP